MGETAPAWTPEERGALLASVGGGRQERPLLPAEVGALFRRELARGVTQRTIAEALYLDSAAMIGRFIRVAELPEEIAAAVGWGRSATSINLTQAQEVARLPSADEQRVMARMVLEFGLSGTEVRGAVQICLRRRVGPNVGVEETVRLRPVIERRYVQIGRITDSSLSSRLADMAPEQRGAAMETALKEIKVEVLDASLGANGYTLVLSEAIAKTLDADRVETELNSSLVSAAKSRK